MFDDIALFIRIVERRSLAAAAADLELPPATVTRRLQRLEEGLGCRLIHRSARKFALTAEGESYFNAYAPLVHQMQATARGLSADVHDLRGRLTVLAPTNAALGFMRPMWSEFATVHPDIQLDLRLGNVNEDMTAGGIDLALRAGVQSDGALTQQRLGVISTILVASPGYLARSGRPERLEQLSDHRLIVSSVLQVWRLRRADAAGEQVIHPRAATLVNDIRLGAQMAADGLGIALLPASEVMPELASGELENLLAPWQGPDRDLFAVWPAGRLLSARARCLRDFLAERIRRVPVLQGELP